jgi:hypothetical protein
MITPAVGHNSFKQHALDALKLEFPRMDVQPLGSSKELCTGVRRERFSPDPELGENPRGSALIIVP